MASVREYTNKIAGMVDDGLLNKDYLIEQLLMWLSEHDVKDFYMANIAPELYDEEEEE